MLTRDHIVESADYLFYRQGFERTSFADIAAQVKISRGNFYYHFKTKDDILDAVIEKRLASTRHLLQMWENEADSPAECIRSFIHILLVNRSDIKRYGCPVGTLATELAKLNHTSKPSVNKIFSLFRRWLKKHFVQLGCKVDADALAMHLLARSQGVATLASAFRDDSFIREEVRQMCDWLDSHTSNTSQT